MIQSLKFTSNITKGILTISLAAFFSLFTLWLIQTDIKYLFLGFELITVIYICFILSPIGSIQTRLSNIRFPVKITLPRVDKNNIINFLPEILLIFFSASLMISSTQLIDNSYLRTFLSLVCGAFLAGYILVSISDIARYFSKLELMVLAFLMSLVFSGVLLLVTIWASEPIKPVILSSSYILISIVSIVKKRRNKSYHTVYRTTSFCNKSDIFAILLSFSFFVFFFSNTYQNMGLVPGLDITRHLNYSLVLLRSPDFYTAFSYILFHAFESAIYVLSGAQQSLQLITAEQTILVTLNIFLPLSVYCLAKRYLGIVDNKIPALSTIFYSIFSNFSFFYFSGLKLGGTSTSDINLLAIDVAEKAFNGTISFLQPFQWFVPVSVSLIILIFLFLMLRMENIPRSKFIALFSILLVSAYFIHVTEAIIFAFLIVFYSVLSRNKKLRLDDALISSAISMGSITIFLFYLTLSWHSDLSPVVSPILTLAPSGVSFAVSIAALLWRKRVQSGIIYYTRIRGKGLYRLSSNILVIIYLYGLVTWLIVGDFRTSSVFDIGVVPWFIYPVMLGIVGLLAILSIRSFSTLAHVTPLNILIFSIFFIFIVGRLISFVNLNYSLVITYWEKRSFLALFLFASLLAPIQLVKFSDQVRTKLSNKLFSHIMIVSCISLIVVIGFSSMILQSSYWFSLTKKNALDPAEFEALEAMRSILDKDRNAFVITPTSTSIQTIAFAGPAYKFSLPQVSVFSKYPEIPLLTLSAHYINHAYLYVHQRDLIQLKSEPQTWFLQHLIPLLPIVFSNKEVTVYNATQVRYPSSESSNVLITPGYHSLTPTDAWYYGYDVVSLANKDYTTKYELDNSVLKDSNTILTFDPPSRYNSEQWVTMSGHWKNESKSLIAGNGKTSDISNVALKQVPISSDTLSIDTSFRDLQEFSNEANYISIVYSWKDTRNFDFGGINVLRNNTYVYFANMRDGQVNYEPAWPGNSTKIKLNLNDILNMKITIDRYQSRLFLNGSLYLTVPHSQTRDYFVSEPKYVGLSYGRLKNIVFDDFNVHESNVSSTITITNNISNYLNYVSAGGNLTVLNTNGYGSIAKYMVYTLKLSSKDNPYLNSTLNGNFSIPKIIDMIAYKSGKLKPIVTNIGKGTLTYLDIFPTISNYLQNKTGGIETYRALQTASQLLNFSSATRSMPNIRDISAYFREMTGEGEIEIESPSINFPQDMVLNRLIVTNGSLTNEMRNVENFDIRGYNQILLRTTGQLELTNGKGLYADLLFIQGNNSDMRFKLLPSEGHNITLTGKSAVTGTAFNIKNISSIELFVSGKLHAYARQPLININYGTIYFTNMYSGKFFPASQDSNINSQQDIRMSGNLSMSVFMSDFYTLSKDIKLSGSVERIPPVIQYDELSSLFSFLAISKIYSLPTLARVLLLVPFLLAGCIIFFDRTHNQRTKKN